MFLRLFLRVWYKIAQRTTYIDMATKIHAFDFYNRGFYLSPKKTKTM